MGKCLGGGAHRKWRRTFEELFMLASLRTGATCPEGVVKDSNFVSTSGYLKVMGSGNKHIEVYDFWSQIAKVCNFIHKKNFSNAQLPAIFNLFLLELIKKCESLPKNSLMSLKLGIFWKINWEQRGL